MHTCATSPAAPEIASMTVLLSRGLRGQRTSQSSVCRQTGVHAHALWCCNGTANAPKLQQTVPVGRNCGHHRNSDSNLHRYFWLGERGQVQAMHSVPNAGVPLRHPSSRLSVQGGRCVFEGVGGRPGGCLLSQGERVLVHKTRSAQMIQLDQQKMGQEASRQAVHSGFQCFELVTKELWHA